MIKKLILLATLLVFLPLTSNGEMMSVKGDKVNLRNGPGRQYSVKWEYGSGFPLKVLQRKNSWVQVEDFEEDSGWIHKSLLHDNPQIIVKANKNSDRKINIRRGPSTNQQIIGEARYGVVFSTVQQRSGWVEVKHESGITGWVKRNLLWGY